MTDTELLKLAINASERAYAPYSKFKVGAAALLEDGNTIEGSNQECSAYGLCMCAERVALHFARSMYPTTKILKIALYSPQDKEITPCGSCRQVMAELAREQKSDFDVITESMTMKVSELLPYAFKL